MECKHRTAVAKQYKLKAIQTGITRYSIEAITVNRASMNVRTRMAPATGEAVRRQFY